MKAITGIIGIFAVLPIWLYLLYKILVMVDATELMFFLYWIYVPAAFFVQIAIRLASDEMKNGR